MAEQQMHIAPPAGSRRETMIDATLRLLRAGGPRAVTHRAVAEEAGVPLAATTYYFSSKEELITEGLARIAGEEVERMSVQAAELEKLEGGPQAVAGALPAVLASALEAEEDGMLPKFEVYLEAARRPALRESCGHWIAAFRSLAETALRLAGAEDPAARGRLLVAAIDGEMVHRLAAGERPYPDARFRSDIELLLRDLIG